MNITITSSFLGILAAIVAALPMLLVIINDYTDSPGLSKVGPTIMAVCWFILFPAILVPMCVLGNNELKAIAEQDAICVEQISSEYNLSEEAATEMVAGARAYVNKDYVTTKNKDLVELVDNKIAVDLETGFVYEADYITTSTHSGLKKRVSVEWNKTDKQYEHIELLREVVEEMG